MTPSARASRARRRSGPVREKVPPLAFPVFDDNRHHLIQWADQLAEGRGAAMVPSMIEACARLRRVRNSGRHERLADFLYHTALAIESGETAGARCILLMALTSFGWASEFADGV